MENLSGIWGPLGVDLLQLAEHEGEDAGGRAQHEDAEHLPGPGCVPLGAKLAYTYNKQIQGQLCFQLYNYNM